VTSCRARRAAKRIEAHPGLQIADRQEERAAGPEAEPLAHADPVGGRSEALEVDPARDRDDGHPQRSVSPREDLAGELAEHEDRARRPERVPLDPAEERGD